MAPLKRSPIRKVRSKPRPGRRKGKDLEALRSQCYERDNGHCVRCGKIVWMFLPQEDDASYHMAHKRNKRMWGDTLDNVQTECGECHRKYHQRGPSMEKPVPPKPVERKD